MGGETRITPRIDLLISSIQKMALYETKSRYYLVGCNNNQTKFRVLKIDRTEPRDLMVTDDKAEYTEKEVRDLLTMIDVGNRTKPTQKGNSGLSRTVSAFGLVGFVRFLEGYYIILITKRRRVATIGHHSVYKIEDTSMIYIPNDSVRYSHPDESRYVKMFQNVDLSSNFYFSYSYDLTHPLQFNMTPPKSILSYYELERARSASQEPPNSGDSVSESPKDSLNSNDGKVENASKSQKKPVPKIGIRTKPKKKYAWNAYLLNLVEDIVHPDWLLYIMHGFIDQSNISVYGHPIFITIIARRSNKYAGTRFLKRGANSEGDVANEVETEQIVFDSSRTSFESGRYTAFLQIRGSIPSHWSQDIAKMVPKPPIILDLGDPYCTAAGLHFNQLLRRYGSPVIVLNLVKKREKKKHESMLSDVYNSTIVYLNQFISEEHQIVHRSFDMARINKAKEANVMPGLAKIAYRLVKKTGIFQSQTNFYCHKLRPHARWMGMQVKEADGCIKQTGVVRVNCVDCLDRTNTAQFALGTVALAFQLYVLGVLEKPELEFESDTLRMLEELYEDHGDTLALQYGGSHLVHRIKTYRKTAPWTSQSRDIMQTLSRYYSNAFSDADKQNAINLFLGIFVPDENKPNVWELATDYYLHHLPAAGQIACHRRSYTQWWEGSVIEHLPLPYEEVVKGSSEEEVEIVLLAKDDERIDSYIDFHRPFELSIMGELLPYTLIHSVRDFMPNCTTNFSPFAVRARVGKRREEMGGSSVSSNPSVTGQSSTSSTASSSTSSSAESGDSSTTSSEEDSLSISDQNTYYHDDDPGYFPFRSLFPTMKQTYGMEIVTPNQHDILMYKKFTSIGRCNNPPSGDNAKRASIHAITLIRGSVFSLDSSYNVTPPTVNRQAKEIYKVYTQRGKTGITSVSRADRDVYERYVGKLR